jgi:metallophosphoesterase superfamily enzyme
MNVLIIGDIHEPFSREGYLEHTLKVRDRFKCDKIVFIGDLIDNHYSSFHDTDPDGYGGAYELKKAIEKLQVWYNHFPDALVCKGNHDEIIKRKAYAHGIPEAWIKDYSDMFNTPGWKFADEWEIDGVLYTHGTGSSGDKAAFNKALYLRKSVVQGHLHSFASVFYSASNKDKIFGMQVGCGVNQEAYAMAYSKVFPRKFIMSCGVVIDDGDLAIPVLMKL